MALLGGACFGKKWLAFVLPLGALLLSDCVLGFHSGMPFVYAAFAVTVCLGFWLRGQRRVIPILTAALASSVLFFGITNFGVWIMGDMYLKTPEGLAACYAAAIPFFRNELLGTPFYTAVLFGGFALVERSFPMLQTRPAAVSQGAVNVIS